MLTFHTVSHTTNTNGGLVEYQRKVTQNSAVDIFDAGAEYERRSFNRRNHQQWSCSDLHDYRWMMHHVRKNPLQSWNLAKRFGTEGAVAGVGAGACLALGIGVVCWPMALAGGIVAGFVCGTAQYNAIEDAKRFDEAIEELGGIASSAISHKIDLKTLCSLQSDVLKCKRKYEYLGPGFQRIAERLKQILEDAKTNRVICWDFLYG